ncbi:hypothetical protein CYMTET_10966 [Cymbomonas tetramitiformis]|uniref:Polycystin cation channel PKD1/PKD2 domain-containing protein n=1 Tax=Cymbomonas tetramitiformis TaxID=36881 RepID=A0AAE0GN81_9CHLO|nr:hypothetical protein CYMTET_10966 [Cymbomonas tetramitiformis]
MDGNYFDGLTRRVTFRMLTYNGIERMFCLYDYIFTRDGTGVIKHDHIFKPFSVDNYVSSTHFARLAFELLFCIFICFNLYTEVREFRETARSHGWRQYFRFDFVPFSLDLHLLHIGAYWAEGAALGDFSLRPEDRAGFELRPAEASRVALHPTMRTRGWNVVDMTSIMLNVTAVITWITFTLCGNAMDMNRRYEIYDLKATPRPLKPLTSDNTGMKDFVDHVEYVTFLLSLSATYMSFNGVNLFLFLARTFKHLDFQPRMGVLTRTIKLAMVELLHFAFILAIVYLCYMIMGSVLFGYRMEAFMTFEKSSFTLFQMLIGNGDIGEEMTNVVDSSQHLYSNLFFFSFMSIVYMIILNFLLAIVVEAFAIAKEVGGEAPAVWDDIWVILRDASCALTQDSSLTSDLEGEVDLLLRRNAADQWALPPTSEDLRARRARARTGTAVGYQRQISRAEARTLVLPCNEAAGDLQDPALTAAKVEWLLAADCNGERGRLSHVAKSIVEKYGEPYEDSSTAAEGTKATILLELRVLQRQHQELAATLDAITTHFGINPHPTVRSADRFVPTETPISPLLLYEQGLVITRKGGGEQQVVFLIIWSLAE